MSLMINKDGVSHINSSKWNTLLAERREIDKLIKEISSGEYLIFDFENDSMDVIAKYMYTITSMGFIDGVNIPAIQHRVVSLNGNPQALANILLNTKSFIDGSEYGPDSESGKDPAFDLVKDNLSSEDGFTKYVNVVAACIAYYLKYNKKATIYMLEGVDVPYIVRYVAMIVRVSEEEANKVTSDEEVTEG